MRLTNLRNGVIATLVGVTVLVGQVATALAAERAWQKVPEFSETWFTENMEPDVRLHVNAPLDEAGRPARGTRLIVFALPNGNTIEQTLGCKMAGGHRLALRHPAHRGANAAAARAVSATSGSC